MHPLICGQELPAASPVANEEFSIDQLGAPSLHGARPDKEPNPHGVSTRTISKPFVWTTAFPDAWARRCVRLRAAQSPKAFVGRVAQRFKAQTYGRRIRCRTASGLRLFEKFVDDVKRLLHALNSAHERMAIETVPMGWGHRFRIRTQPGPNRKKSACVRQI